MKVLHIALGGRWVAMEKAFEVVGHIDWTHKVNWGRIPEPNKALNPRILELQKKVKPDLVFMQLQTGGLVNDETLIELNKSSITVNWCGDVRKPLPQWYIDSGKHFTHTLFSNMPDVEEARKAGVNADFLQIGVDTDHYKLDGLEDNSAEIVFLGNHYSKWFPLSDYRLEIVRYLRKEYQKKFQAYGNGWGSGYKPQTHRDQEVKIYRGCKVALNISHFNYDRYTSDRMFRIMASGAFCLSHNYTGIEKDFIVGKHLDVFNGVNDIKEKIDYYLNNNEERNRIRLDGMNHVRENYTWDDMMENLKTIVNK